jgi:hypothetical protein
LTEKAKAARQKKSTTVKKERTLTLKTLDVVAEGRGDTMAM